MLPVALSKFIRKRALQRIPLPDGTSIEIERWLRGREDGERLRRADAAVVSYEKSGRTWLRVMLSYYYQRRYGLPETRLLHYDKMHQLNAEVPIVQFTHDRYLASYCRDESAILSLYAGKPVVMLARDPRDVAVSLYFQWLHRAKARNKRLDGMPLEDRDCSIFDFVTGAEAGIPAVASFLNRWLERSRSLPQLVIYRYEELRSDTEAQIAEVLKTLGEAPTREEVADVVAYAEFEKMKQREGSGQVSDSRLTAGDVNNPDSFKARRAKVGGYRDYFDERQIEAIDRMVEDLLDPSFGYGA